MLPAQQPALHPAFRRRTGSTYAVCVLFLIFAGVCPQAAKADTLGYSVDQTTYDVITGNINASIFQATTSFSATNMAAKLNTATGNFKLAIYSDNAGNPGTLLGQTNEIANPTAGWFTFTLASAVAITSGTSYWLAVWTNADPAQIAYLSGSGTAKWMLIPYGTWPTTWTTSGSGPYTHCIFAYSTAAPPASSKYRVWSASAAGAASNSANWTPSGAIAAGDTIVLDNTSVRNMTWDVNVAVAAWIQNAGYTGTVTVGTQYSGGIDSLNITGDCTINGGKWRHTQNTTSQTYRLKTRIGGNLVLGANATITVDSLGYDPKTGPGSGTAQGGNAYDGAAYGGRGSNPVSQTYGSITAPWHIGSGSSGSGPTSGINGGGAIWLNVAGSSTINGRLTANGNARYNAGGGGSGGSIYLRTGTITGTTGRIRANGGVDGWSGNGGGGRIAVILTQSGATFSSFAKDSITAYGNGPNGGAYANIYSAAGTVYLQTQAQGANGGELIIRDKMRVENDQQMGPHTTLNDSAAATLTIGSLTIKDSAAFEIGADDRLTISGAGTAVTVGPNDSLICTGALALDRTVVSNSGTIILSSAAALNLDSLYLGAGTGLSPAGTMVITRAFRVGTAVQPDGVYTSANFAEIVGSGSVLVGAGKVWTNAGGNNLASNGANWSGGTIPVSTDNIMLSSASTANMTWDLNVPVASWFQSAGYTGTVTVGTQYSGTPDTLRITGDCTIYGGKWAHRDNTTTDQYRLCVKVGGNFTLGSGARIDATGLGRARNSGIGTPGSGTGFPADGGSFGAAYGGVGGQWDDSKTPLPVTYGSYSEPVDLGSGGNDGNGSDGGGAVLLVVGGTCTINDSIKANGGATVAYGGSGGSVYIKANTITGSGRIAVDGAPSSNNGYPTGGGGRVAIYVSSGGFSGLTNTPTAYGGQNNESWSHRMGAAGTVYLDSTNNGQLDGRLIIDNNNRQSSSRITTRIPSGQTWTAGVLRLAGSGVLDAPGGTTLNLGSATLTTDTNSLNGIRVCTPNFTVPANFHVGRWQLIMDTTIALTTNLFLDSGAILTHSGFQWADTLLPVKRKVDLSLTGGLTVARGAAINTRGRGYYEYAGGQGKGPGGGERGGSYGGQGIATSPHTYGSITRPADFGSAGFVSPGSVGGGQVRLRVGGTSTINGTINCRGNGAGAGGSGSGGSIWLTTGTLAGTGSIRADGGTDDWVDNVTWFSSCAGGGRIAINLTGAGADFAGFPADSIHAWAGCRYAAAGTVYLETMAQGHNKGSVMIDNRGYATSPSPAARRYFTTIGVQTGLFTDTLDNIEIIESDSGLCSLTVSDTVRSYQLTTGLVLGGHTLTCQKFRSRGTWMAPGTYSSTLPINGVSGWGSVIVTGGAPAIVAIVTPAADFEQGAGTVLTVEVRDADGIALTGDNATKITFSPTLSGTITGVTDGTGDGTYGTPGGAEVITVRNGRATIALNDNVIETFQVAIANDRGCANPANQTVVVRAPVPPTVTISPADTSIVEGLPLTLRVRGSAGSRPFVYRWQKGADTTSLGSDSTFAISNAKAADSGQYRCIVSNISGRDTGFAAVHVVIKPRAKISANPSNTVTNVPVVFTDSSSGSIAQWKLSFGDGKDTTYASRLAAIVHAYADSGTYTCKLVVTGGNASLKDSMTLTVSVSKVGDNPVRIDARVISATRVELTLRGVKNVSSDLLQPPWADSIFLWFSARGLPPALDTAIARHTKSYGVAALKAAMGADSIYHDTITVPAATTPGDTLYGVWASPQWGNTRPSLYSRYNAAAIVMAPVNPLVMTAEFRGNTGSYAQPVLHIDALDSVRVTLSNASAIDTTVVAQVCIGYGFRETQPLGVDSLNAGMVARAGASFVWGKRNTLFTGDTAQLYVWMFLIGRNNLVSNVARDTFMVGWLYPDNPCRLAAGGEVTANQIPLVWNSPGAVDSVRILYSLSQIALGQPQEGQYQVISPAKVTDTALTFSSNRTTHYYFAIQVRKYLHWSSVTALSRYDVTTPDFDPADSVANTVKIDSIWFVDAANMLHVKWHVQSTPGLSRNIGFRYSPDRTLATTREPNLLENCKIFALDSLRGETVLDMSNTVIFDTIFYLGAWLQSTRGPWARPTDSSTASFLTSSPTWQRITYFGARDTVIAFNGAVLLRREPGYTLPALVDTVRAVSAPDSIAGLVPFVKGFTLQRNNLQSFSIGVRYDSLPQGITVADLGIYQDSAGFLMVSYGFSVDPAGRTVWVKLRENQITDSKGNPLPFFLMADTMRPILTMISDTGAVLADSNALVDTFTLRDNIANVQWKLWYGKDGDAYRSMPLSGTTCGSCALPESVVTRVSSWYVTEDNGIRALLAISDGVHTDSVNLSRQAWREFSDPAGTNQMEWTPVWSTALLDTPNARFLIDRLRASTPDAGPDKSEFRLFRWQANERNQLDSLKWIEYPDQDTSTFNFEPGSVMWLKTREAQTFDLGKGRTVSQKRNASIRMNAGGWTDIALPFRYDIKAGDIYAASGISPDSLEIYKWELDTSQETNGTMKITWVTKALYIVDVPDTQINNPEVRLLSRAASPFEAYSVFCRPSGTQTLLVPPIPAAVSTYVRPSGMTKRLSGGWAVKVMARTDNGISLNTVYCGYTPGVGTVTYHPLAPRFPAIKAGVYDPGRRRLYGHAFTHRLDNGGSSFNIAIVNDGDLDETVRYSLVPAPGFPDGQTARMYDPANGTFLGMGQDATAVVPAHGSLMRVVTLGSSAFVNHIPALGRLALENCFVDRARGMIHVRYQVPMIGVSSVEFRLYDMNGRRVAAATVGRSLKCGANEFVWNGTSGAIPAGMYVLTMRARNGSGKTAGSARMVVPFVR